MACSDWTTTSALAPHHLVEVAARLAAQDHAIAGAHRHAQIAIERLLL